MSEKKKKKIKIGDSAVTIFNPAKDVSTVTRIRPPKKEKPPTSKPKQKK